MTATRPGFAALLARVGVDLDDRTYAAAVSGRTVEARRGAVVRLLDVELAVDAARAPMVAWYAREVARRRTVAERDAVLAVAVERLVPR